MSDELSPAQRLTRQELLRRGVLGGAAAALAPSIFDVLDVERASAAVMRAEAGTINFFSWQGYDLLDDPED